MTTSMPASLKDAINKTVQKYTDNEVCESRVDLAYKVIRTYQAQFMYIPEEWLGYMRKLIAKRLVWEQALIGEGYTIEELKDMSFYEMRETMSEHEYIETTTATSTGGVSVKRTPIKQAA